MCGFSEKRISPMSSYKLMIFTKLLSSHGGAISFYHNKPSDNFQCALGDSL